MTTSVTYPTPLLEASSLDRHILDFIAVNPSGVRNADVGRAIGYNDSRQWFSYGLLESLITRGRVEKRSIKGRTLYFISTPEAA